MRTFKNSIVKATSIGIFIIVSSTFLFLQSCKNDKKETQHETVLSGKENVIEIITKNMDFQMPEAEVLDEKNSVFRISYGLSIIINIVTKQKGVVGRFSNAPHVKLHFWVLTYLLAGIPTSLWLLSAKATVEGVVL